MNINNKENKENKEKEEKFYVYGLKLVASDKVFFVGVGQGELLVEDDTQEAFIMLGDITSEAQAKETAAFIQKNLEGSVLADCHPSLMKGNKICVLSRAKQSLNNGKKKPVVNCRGKVFSSAAAGARFYGLSRQNVHIAITKGVIRSSAGKYENGTKIRWSYAEEEAVNPVQLGEVK